MSLAPIVIIPYNTVNVLVSASDISNLLSKFGIENLKVKNLSHFQEGFTHKSYIKKEYFNIHAHILKQEKDTLLNVIDLQESSNERLEFLGDTVIKCVIASYLFKRYYEEDEGFMTRLKTKLEDTKSLAKYARRLGLESFMLVSKQIEDNNGRNSDKLLEDTFEAFIGALYEDQGFPVCKTLMDILLETEIDYSEILYKDTNYKDRLLRFYHSNKWSHPVYVLIKEENIMSSGQKGSNQGQSVNKKMYTMGVNDFQGNIIAQATDTSKKRAEQKACAYALIKFNQMSIDQIEDIETQDLN
jgi:ribonuclease-3